MFESLGISEVKVASLPADLDATAWGNAHHRHPGWVHHVLLVGNAESAVLLLRRLLAGYLLPPGLLAQKRAPRPVDLPTLGRPWQSGSGYGHGLMISDSN